LRWTGVAGLFDEDAPSGSTALAVTSIDTSWLSHSHRTRLPVSSRPLPLLNQNLDVIRGLTTASNTSPTGRRTSIPVFATGVVVRLMASFMCGPRGG
jgi:hypothetical protein